MGPSQADALSAEKIEAIGIEYSYLLTSQLDSQREYYEEQIGELRMQLGELKALVEKLSDGFKTDEPEVKPANPGDTPLPSDISLCTGLPACRLAPDVNRGYTGAGSSAEGSGSLTDALNVFISLADWKPIKPDGA